VIETLPATCLFDRHFVDWRDWALLLVAGASERRRRSEVAGLRGEDLMHEVPVPRRSEDPVSRKVTKTRSGSGAPRPTRTRRTIAWWLCHGNFLGAGAHLGDSQTHIAAVAIVHCSAASVLNWRSVRQETTWRWRVEGVVDSRMAGEELR
jgi:hypothetical protein